MTRNPPATDKQQSTRRIAQFSRRRSEHGIRGGSRVDHAVAVYRQVLSGTRKNAWRHKSPVVQFVETANRCGVPRPKRDVTVASSVTGVDRRANGAGDRGCFAWICELSEERLQTGLGGRVDVESRAHIHQRHRKARVTERK